MSDRDRAEPYLRFTLVHLSLFLLVLLLLLRGAVVPDGCLFQQYYLCGIPTDLYHAPFVRCHPPQPTTTSPSPRAKGMFKRSRSETEDDGAGGFV